MLVSGTLLKAALTQQCMQAPVRRALIPDDQDKPGGLTWPLARKGFVLRLCLGFLVRVIIIRPMLVRRKRRRPLPLTLCMDSLTV